MNRLNTADVHFTKVQSLCTDHEKQLYDVLSKNLDTYYHDQFVICPKVRIVDMVTQTDENKSIWNRVTSRHVDFLLCKKHDLQPVLAIELQDPYHTTKKWKYRDLLVHTVCKSAWLKLLPLWTTDEQKVWDFLKKKLGG